MISTTGIERYMIDETRNAFAAILARGVICVLQCVERTSTQKSQCDEELQPPAATASDGCHECSRESTSVVGQRIGALARPHLHLHRDNNLAAELLTFDPGWGLCSSLRLSRYRASHADSYRIPDLSKQTAIARPGSGELSCESHGRVAVVAV